MQITEKKVYSSDSFIDRVLSDVKTRQENLFLNLKLDNLSKQGDLETLFNQMDLLFELDQEEYTLKVPEFSINIFREKLFEILGDENLDQQLAKIIQNNSIFWKAGRFKFNLSKKPLIYGILNITPDSFYDGGWYQNKSDIAKRIEEMIESGVDVIEVGGQTTRPGFQEIAASEELDRIESAIELIRSKYKNVAIAVDTYKYEVMEKVIKNVDIINDVNAFTDDQRKLELLKQSDVGLLTMHSARDKNYSNLTGEMKNFFEKNIDDLTKSGIDIDRIALDQGVGYAKIADGYQDYAMMKNIDQFNYLRRPMMVAISRKGFGAKLFNLKKEDRLEVTLIAEAYMYLHGGRILRVHDLNETLQLVKMLDVIRNGYWFGEKDGIS
ncbi:dihydropteroate synthase [Pediococcus stilesii]|uniref:Dihydropteroate synthase n=1 Tax=Pediococcus stilesii TaxID=331679 RepID=A0A0R2KUJ8_9LACO|nr:dihydropteroate synthase [Pediococcus stilesii]KRN93145.1 dihydropteroate synthase [Pediococcus stilesii]